FVGAIAGAALISACSQPSDSQQTAAQQQQQAADADAQGGRREGLGRRREDRHRRSIYGVSAELRRRRARIGGEPTHRRAQRTGPQSGGREGLGRRREGRHRRGLYGIYSKFRGWIVNIVRLLSARVEENRPPPFEHVDALVHVCNYWSSDRDHRARAACRGASRAWRTVRRSCWSSLHAK